MSKRYADSLDERAFPMNFTACENYGGCPFKPVCTTRPNDREKYLRATLKKRTMWNPLITRLTMDISRDNEALLSAEYARSLLIYEPNTGKLYWKQSIGRRKAGVNLTSTRIKVNGVLYSRNRLCWLLFSMVSGRCN